MEKYYRIRTPEVTSEDFKNEVLIIDLRTGHYHSLRGVAAVIWRLLDQGHSLDASVKSLAKHYPAADENVEGDAREFAGELEKLGLIVPAEERTPGGGAIEEGAQVYAKPVIDSYGDLQELLLLDPIHEIAPEAGWPHRLDAA